VRQGEGKSKGRAADRRGLGPDPAAVRLREAPGDRQSQSAPFAVVVSCKPDERLEDLVQIVRLDGGAVVGDAKNDLLVTRPRQ
jgi:hypothetical protein